MSTFAQLKTRVSRKLRLDTTAGSDEQEMVGEHLNEAVLEVLLETHCFVALDPSVALSAGVGDYLMDTDILAIHKLINSDDVPLERVTEGEIDEYRRASASATSTTRYALTGSNLLMVWPEPASADTLAVYFVPRPTPMSDDSHDPSNATYGGIPSEFHKTLEFYALWQGADYDDDSSSNQGDRYFGQYQVWLGKMKKAQKMKGGQRMPRARTGRVSYRSSDPART